MRIALFFVLALLILQTPGFASEGPQTFTDIAYGNKPLQKLDIYAPAPVAGKKPTVVVFFHGGIWQMGDKSEYAYVGEGLAALGYVGVVANYRLFPEVKYPDFVKDTAQAITWVHEHISNYGNPENIYIAGHSAGAYNVMMVALNPEYMKQVGGQMEWIKGAIGLAGAYSLVPFKDPNVEAIFATETDSKKIEPINYANLKGYIPRLMIVTGLADGTISPKNSWNLYEALQAGGHQTYYREYDGVDHMSLVQEFSSTPPTGVVRKEIYDFIEKPLKQPTPRVQPTPSAK